MKYRVSVVHEFDYHFDIEAESEEEAMDIAEHQFFGSEKYKNGDYDCDDVRADYADEVEDE